MAYLILALSTLNFIGIRSFIIYLLFYLLINLFFFIILQSLLLDQFNQLIIFISQLQVLSRSKKQ
jgi:hypothetical protein